MNPDSSCSPNRWQSDPRPGILAKPERILLRLGLRCTLSRRTIFHPTSLALTLLVFALCGIAGLASCGSNPNTPITVAFTTGFLPPGAMATSTSAGIAATVSNDTRNLGVRWSVTCGSSPCGSFSSTTSPSTVPTTYESPASVPKGNSVTVTAASIADPTETVSATITIN